MLISAIFKRNFFAKPSYFRFFYVGAQALQASRFCEHLKVPKFQAPFGDNFSALGVSRFGTFTQRSDFKPNFEAKYSLKFIQVSNVTFQHFLLRNVSILGNQQICSKTLFILCCSQPSSPSGIPIISRHQFACAKSSSVY